MKFIVKSDFEGTKEGGDDMEVLKEATFMGLAIVVVLSIVFVPAFTLVGGDLGFLLQLLSTAFLTVFGTVFVFRIIIEPIIKKKSDFGGTRHE